MAITVIPTQTEGSGPEDLGKEKVNATTYTDPDTQQDATNHNNLVLAVIAVTEEVGLSDGSTVGSVRKALVDGLATKANAALTLTAGTGLTGGGDLSANRTFAVDIAGTAPPAIGRAGAAGSSGKVADRDHNHDGGTVVVSAKTANYTLVNTDEIIQVDTTSGVISLTLPTPSARSFMVQKTGGGTNKITLVRAGSEQIMGVGASYDLPGSATAYDAATPQAWFIYSDGTNWFVA